MIKRCLLMVFFVIGSPAINAADAPYIVEEIRNVPTVNKIEIYSRAQQWVAENFKSAKKVIDHTDQSSGLIIGNGAVDIYSGVGIFKSNSRFTFKFKIEIKDEKFRITFNNVSLLIDGYEKPIESTNTDQNYPATKTKFTEIADSLARFVTEKPKAW